ncbi:MAG: glycosyltransferase family protein [Flavobacteriaceae bacterium]|jgi:spore coat polysaccharide biosynthesis protein SpsF (cytidylyltransferase family)|nr:glycosyltransferase family protein [Flavobacteriaceae bacterium]
MALKINLITQARMGSTRFPGKILKKINGKSLLEIHIERLLRCNNIDNVIVATTKSLEDDKIEVKCKRWGCDIFRGNENDVLDRYYKASLLFKPDYIVRVTSDCPLIDPVLIDQMVDFTINNKLDYCSNTLVENYPDGQDVEIFTFDSLKKTWLEAKLNSEREHVTPYMKMNSTFYNKNEFVSANYPCQGNFNSIRMTVDEKIDFKLIKILVQKLGIELSWREYVDFIMKNNLKINQNIIRNEGYLKSLKND